MHGYWQSTRHPWPCLLLVMTLLVGYEVCMYYQAQYGITPHRAGLDSWLHASLQTQQWNNPYLPGLLIGVICLGWTVIKWDRSPPESLTLLVGMLFESLLFAAMLWCAGLLCSSFLANLSVNTRIMQSMAMLGSGIFEEVFFRLLGFGLLYYSLKQVSSDRTALILALLTSSLGFAAAHYIGPSGESWQLSTFAFRSLAGLGFAAIFHYRGLGIVVGTHSAYNILVGVIA